MNKTRALCLIVAIALLAAVVVALHLFDPMGLIRRFHGME